MNTVAATSNIKLYHGNWSDIGIASPVPFLRITTVLLNNGARTAYLINIMVSITTRRFCHLISLKNSFIIYQLNASESIQLLFNLNTCSMTSLTHPSPPLLSEIYDDTCFISLSASAGQTGMPAAFITS